MTSSHLGIVIPTLNEEVALPLLLQDLKALTLPHEVVVADGGSGDGTRAVAERAGATFLQAPRGRGRQMNAGAQASSAPWLLFLHADSRLPPETLRALEEWVARPPATEAGTFRFRLDAHGLWWRILEVGQRVRERMTGLAYGDQGLIVSRARFRAVGGYPELPVMEDVEMIRRLRRSGGVASIPRPLLSSARRYREEGPFRGWLRNAALISLYGAGVSPSRLARHYPERKADPNGRILLVFAKDPVPGKVKTRLAKEIGGDRAAALYRKMGRQVVDGVRGGPYSSLVCFSPQGAREAFLGWLGEEELHFTPQSNGDLGERLTTAFEQAFSNGRTVCVIGTDAPQVDASVVEAAFRELERPGGADAVFGPALDGGYYLLGLRRPEPILFQDIPWSTDRVLERSLSQAGRAGLKVHLLEPLSDVDRLEDLPSELRRELGLAV